ncbi:MAG: hypothetical protein V4553_21360 [Bacteroidota bacterium]
MEVHYYLNKFQKAIDGLDKQPFVSNQLELKAGVWLDSVALKIQKPDWLNKTPDAKPFGESFFFSVWINDQTIKQGNIYYNIHAIKTRELKDYHIKSREFADAFNKRFEPFKSDWPNLYKPLAPHTLMEGWITLNADTLENEIALLSRRFSAIAFIIDELLAERKK